MIDTSVTDHAGKTHAIRSADDLNRIIADLDHRRNQLANLMLGQDRGAAIAAERTSDHLEDVFLPKFIAEIERVRRLLEGDAADEHRRAKARAILERARRTTT